VLNGVSPRVTLVSGTSEAAPVAADLQEAALAAAGDTRAFERLYRVHAARIHGLVRRMLGTDEATEVTQDVFVRAWQKIGSFRGEAAFGTWLHRVAVNVVLTRRAQLGTRRNRFIADEQVLENLPAQTGSRDFGIDFESAVARLPEGARHIFVLHDVEGYRHEEIAGLLGVTSGTTKAQLHRARMLLRRHLGPAR
jgi:RNA polymerase sigma-70 factor (ECF subfamily)